MFPLLSLDKHGFLDIFKGMKEIAQQILSAPFNWTGLTLRELVDAGRIPESNLNGNLKALATEFLNNKYGGCYTGDIQEYLKEKKELIAALEAEFSSQKD